MMVHTLCRENGDSASTRLRLFLTFPFFPLWVGVNFKLKHRKHNRLTSGVGYCDPGVPNWSDPIIGRLIRDAPGEMGEILSVVLTGQVAGEGLVVYILEL